MIKNKNITIAADSLRKLEEKDILKLMSVIKQTCKRLGHQVGGYQTSFYAILMGITNKEEPYRDIPSIKMHHPFIEMKNNVKDPIRGKKFEHRKGGKADGKSLIEENIEKLLFLREGKDIEKVMITENIIGYEDNRYENIIARVAKLGMQVFLLERQQLRSEENYIENEIVSIIAASDRIVGLHTATVVASRTNSPTSPRKSFLPEIETTPFVSRSSNVDESSSSGKGNGGMSQ